MATTPLSQPDHGPAGEDLAGNTTVEPPIARALGKTAITRARQTPSQGRLIWLSLLGRAVSVPS